MNQWIMLIYNLWQDFRGHLRRHLVFQRFLLVVSMPPGHPAILDFLILDEFHLQRL